jgi:hypothetical protein
MANLIAGNGPGTCLPQLGTLQTGEPSALVYAVAWKCEAQKKSKLALV